MANEPRKMQKYVVPVDGQWHTIESAKPLRVGHAGTRQEVVFWAESPPDKPTRDYRVFATGEPVEGSWVGTVQAPGGKTWHLYGRS